MEINQATENPPENKHISMKKWLRMIILYVKTRWKLKFIVFNFMLILILGLLAIKFTHVNIDKSTHGVNQNKQSAQYFFTQKLNDIQGRLSVIEQSLHSDQNQKNITQLESKLQSVNQSIQTLSNNNTQAIESNLSNSSNNLQQQISHLSHNIADLKQSMQKTVYLKSSALPFKVMSIDSIEQQNVVTIAYDYKNVALEQNDAIAGWSLIKTDYAAQTADFVNSKDQHVLIHLSDGR